MTLIIVWWDVEKC